MFSYSYYMLDCEAQLIVIDLMLPKNQNGHLGNGLDYPMLANCPLAERMHIGSSWSEGGHTELCSACLVGSNDSILYSTKTCSFCTILVLDL